VFLHGLDDKPASWQVLLLLLLLLLLLKMLSGVSGMAVRQSWLQHAGRVSSCPPCSHHQEQRRSNDSLVQL
jgi:hypothetical protein